MPFSFRFTVCPTAPPYKEFEKRALQLLDYNLNISAEEWDGWTHSLMNALRRSSGYGDDDGRRVALELLSEVMSKESLKNSRPHSSRMPCTFIAQAGFNALLLHGLEILPSQPQHPTPSANGYSPPMKPPVTNMQRVILRGPPTPVGTISTLGAFGHSLETPRRAGIAV